MKFYEIRYGDGVFFVRAERYSDALRQAGHILSDDDFSCELAADLQFVEVV